MLILRFLWKFKVGAIAAGLYFVISFLYATASKEPSFEFGPALLVLLPVMLSTIFVLSITCAVSNFMPSIELEGVGEACATNWIALVPLLVFFVAFLLMGSVVEFFIRKNLTHR